MKHSAPAVSRSYVIPNLANACAVLRLLGRSKRGLRIIEVARELELPQTTTLRILSTLVQEGFARRVDGRFHLGPALISLGETALANIELRSLALPILEQLTRTTEETSHVAIPAGFKSLILAVQDSPHPLRAASRPGTLADLHCSSTGKVFLAWVLRDRLEEFIREESPPRRTPQTHTSLGAIRADAEAVRAQGYALDNEEYHPGVRCLACPVHDSGGDVVAAIGITASVHRFAPDAVPRIHRSVELAARALSRQIGHAP